MRIGIASTFPPYRGGIAQFNDAMARALEQAGHEVHCATWSRQYPALLFPGKTQFEPGKTIADASMPATLDSISPILGSGLDKILDIATTWTCCCFLFGTRRWPLRSRPWPPKPNVRVSDKWSPSCTMRIRTTAKRGNLP